MDEKTLSEHCRKKGVYSHDIQQWKQDFVRGDDQNNKVISRSEIKTLKLENKALKKELQRKEKTLAEAAALLARIFHKKGESRLTY